MNVRILRGLWGARLPCGCTAGIYETYAGGTVTILDERHDACRLAKHRKGAVIDVPARSMIARGGTVPAGQPKA